MEAHLERIVTISARAQPWRVVGMCRGGKENQMEKKDHPENTEQIQS